MILDNKQDYNAAIALNNIGVDLLERRCYKQAAITLLDAISVMKAVMRRLSASAVSESNDRLAVEAMIQRANRVKARPTPMESKSYYRIVNLADNYSDILVEEQHDGSSRETIFPIRIDDVSYDACSPGCLNDRDIQCAILLHNLGLANLCVAWVSPESSDVEKVVSVFEMAESIVEKRISEMEDELTLRQAACLNIAILMGLLRSLSCEDEIEAVRRHLWSLRSALSTSTSEDAFRWLTSGIQCAPAA
jgi:hypothetical protein